MRRKSQMTRMAPTSPRTHMTHASDMARQPTIKQRRRCRSRQFRLVQRLPRRHWNALPSVGCVVRAPSPIRSSASRRSLLRLDDLMPPHSAGRPAAPRATSPLCHRTAQCSGRVEHVLPRGSLSSLATRKISTRSCRPASPCRYFDRDDRAVHNAEHVGIATKTQRTSASPEAYL